MRKYLSLIFSLFIINAYAQNSNDVALNNRIKEYLVLSKDLNYNKLIEYMHPKLFSIAPKEAVVKSLQQAFAADDEINIVLDSFKMESISAPFNHDNIVYRKVDYYMSMSLTFTDTAMSGDEEFIDIMKSTFTTIFPGKEITYNKDKKTMVVAGIEIMFALKDPKYKEWMFLGYQKTNETLLKMLYPDEVIKHFKLL